MVSILLSSESQGDVGVSIIDETTPRSLLSLESSAADNLGNILTYHLSSRI